MEPRREAPVSYLTADRACAGRSPLTFSGFRHACNFEGRDKRVRRLNRAGLAVDSMTSCKQECFLLRHGA